MSGTQNVVQATRRTWDRAEYARRAQENDKAKLKQRPDHTREKGPDEVTEAVQNTEVDIKESIGKRQLQGSKSGFYCDICDCLMKDSTAFRDHVNGKKHQALAGAGKAGRASLNDVQRRIKEVEAQRREQQVDHETKIRRQREENEKEDELLKEARKESKRRKREEKLEEENKPKELWDQEDLGVAEDFGLPFTFGGSKKQK